MLAAGRRRCSSRRARPTSCSRRRSAGDYVCIQAFVNPTAAAEARARARSPTRAREATGCVVTHGFGPRYLHSTGQLHKGGPTTGLFLQVVDDTGEELAIPGQPFGFGRLIRAQAAGDFESLRSAAAASRASDLEDVARCSSA